MATTRFLSATGIRKSYGRKLVLDDADLDVHGGEVVALVGENGAGKTTLLRICAGLLTPDAGQIAVAGRIGYCPQDPGVLDLLTADEHLVYFGAAIGLSRGRARANGRRLLAEFGFTDSNQTVAKDLSGGNRQKLNLALALLGDPPVLCWMNRTKALTTEPTSTSGNTSTAGAGKAKRSSSSPTCWPNCHTSTGLSS